MEPGDPALDAGITQLTVTWGREHFQPIQFHGFDVGPFEAVVTVQAGETVEQAFGRAQARLRELAEAEWPAKLEAYLDRIRQLGARMKA